MPGYKTAFAGDNGFNAGLPIDEVERLNRRIGMLTKYTPELTQDPMAVYTLASAQNTDDDMLKSVLQTSEFVNIQNRITDLREAPDDFQRAHYNSLPKVMQRKYRQAGFVPPEREDNSDDNGWFKVDLPNLPKIGGIDLPNLPEIGPGDGIAAVVAPIGAGVGLAMNTVGWGMEALGTMPRAISRLYRTLEYAEDRHGGAFNNLGKAWRDVERGESVFYADAEEKALKAVRGDEDLFELAKLTASTSDPMAFEEIAAQRYKRDSPEFGKEVLRLYTISQEKDFQKAQRALRFGMMSLGRAFGNALFTPGTKPYNLVSGSIDGGLQLVDPSLLLGGVSGGFKAGMWGHTSARAMKAGEKFDRLDMFQDLYKAAKSGENLGLVQRKQAEGVGRFADRVSEEFSKIKLSSEVDDAADLVKLSNELPQLVQSLDRMVDWHRTQLSYGKSGLSTGDGVFDFLKSDEGMQALSTNLGGFGKNRYHVPHVTAAGQAKIRTKELFRVNINQLVTDPKYIEQMRDLIESGDLKVPERVVRAQKVVDVADEASATIAYLRDHLVGAPVKAGAQLVRGLTQHAPRSKLFDLHGDQAVAEFTRIANMGVLGNLPPALVDDYINRFALNTTAGNRHVVARQFFTDMLQTSGAPTEMVERYMGKLFKFSVNSADEFALPGFGPDEVAKMALWPGVQESNRIAVPDIKQLARELKEYNFMGAVIGRTPIAWADAKMGRFWNPAVLLRVGFIPRAFGEELFNFMLREGPVALAEARVSRWAATGKAGQKAFNPRARAYSAREELGLDWDDLDWKALDELKPIRQVYRAMGDIAASRMGNSKLAAEWDLLDSYGKYRALRLFDYSRAGLLAPARAAQSGLTKAGIAAGLTSDGKMQAAALLAHMDDSPETLARWLDENPQYAEAASMIKSMEFREFSELLDASLTASPTMDFRDARTQIQNRQIVTVRAPGGELEDVEKVVNTSNFKKFDRDDADFFPSLVRLYQRDLNNPFKVAGLRVLDDLLDPATADRVQMVASGTRFARDTPEETVEAFRKFVRTSTTLNRKMRKALRGFVDSNDPDSVDEFARLVNRYKGREGSEDLVTFFERLQSSPDGAAIFRTRDPMAKVKIMSDKDDLLIQIRNRIREEMYLPENSRLLTGNARTIAVDGAPVRVPIQDGQLRLYTPVASDEVYGRFNVLENVQRFEDSLAQELAAIGKADLYDEIVDLILPVDPKHLDEVTASRSAISQHDDKPVSAWASTNPDVARAVSKALHVGAQTADEVPLIGFKDVAEGAIKRSRNDLVPVGGLRQTGETTWEKSISFHMDRRHGSLVEPINPDEYTEMLKVKDPETGAVSWMDRSEYDTLKQQIEAGGDDVYAGALKVRKRTSVEGADEFDLRRLPTIQDRAIGSGVSMESALDAWATDMASDLLAQYTNGEGRILHELVEPSVAGDFNAIDLNRMANDQYPDAIYGPEYIVPPPVPTWDKIVRFGFDKVIGRAGAAIIRNDMFVHYVGRAIDELRPTVQRRMLDAGLHETVAPIISKLGSDNGEDVLTAWSKLPAWAKGPDGDLRKVNELLQERLGLVDPIYTKAWYTTGLDEAGKPVRVKKMIRTVDEETGEVITDWRLRAEVLEMRAKGEIPKNPYDLQARQIAELRSWTKNIENYSDHLREMVLSQGFNEIAPFIDDRRFRSQFQENVGSFIPFMFAEEQFVKRWARTLSQNPDAAYKAILTMNGLRATGVIKEDPLTGEEIFVYPGSSQLTNLLSKTVELITGKKIQIPFAPAFGGQVKYTMPGLDGGVPGAPAVGPLVGVGLNALAHVFPEAQGLKDWSLGEQAEGRNWTSFFVPSSLRRLWDVVGKDDEQMASAMIQAMAYMEANEQTPGDDATTREIEEYKERVQSQARVILATRFVYGFAGPASPKMLAPDAELNAELQELLRSGAPVDEAIGAYLKKNPEADPYTVFKTEVVSGAPLSQTEESLKWMDDNDNYLKTFPMAAPYLMPQDRSDTFERKAYFDQLARGMRIKRSPDEWYDEMKFASAADLYFESIDNFEAEMLAVDPDDTVTRKGLRQSFDMWKQAYFASHRTFHSMLRDPDKAMRRQNILNEMRLVVADPDAPVQVEDMRTLIESYDEFKASYDSLKGDRRSAVVDFKENLKNDFAGWAYGYVRRNPSTRAFFQRVMAPELELEFEAVEEAVA